MDIFRGSAVLIKPLNPFYFIKKLLNRKKHTDFSSTNYIFDAPQTKQVSREEVIRQLDKFEKDHDAIWETASKNIKVAVDRSAAYMNWRYIDKPGEHYYRYGLYRNKVLAGIIVFSLKGNMMA